MRHLPEEAKEIAALSRPRPQDGTTPWAALLQMQPSLIGERFRESRASFEGRTIFDSAEERLDRAEAQIEIILSILEEIVKEN